MKNTILNITYFLLLNLNYVSAQGWQNFDTSNSPILSNTIRSIGISNENNIWFGTDNGISSFNGVLWTNYTVNEGLSSNNINVINFSERIWIGSDSGITSFELLNSGLLSEVGYLNTSNSLIQSDTVLSLLTVGKNTNWIGTNNGISIIDLDSIINISIGGELKNKTILTLDNQSDGWVYAGTKGGGVSRFYYDDVDGISSASIIENKWSGLLSDTVMSIFIDSNNTRWFGTDNGVSVHSGNDTKENWELHNTDSGLPHNYVRSITGDKNGNIWIGTKTGIAMYDGDEWIPYNKDDGLISNNVFDIEVDLDNNIWIATDEGVSKFSGVPLRITDGTRSKNDFKINLTAYPNPFNQTVVLDYSIPLDNNVSIKIYDLLGKELAVLVSEFKTSGNYKIYYDGKNLSSGVYLVRLNSGKFTSTKKILLMK